MNHQFTKLVVVKNRRMFPHSPVLLRLLPAASVHLRLLAHQHGAFRGRPSPEMPQLTKGQFFLRPKKWTHIMTHSHTHLPPCHRISMLSPIPTMLAAGPASCPGRAVTRGRGRRGRTIGVVPNTAVMPIDNLNIVCLLLRLVPYAPLSPLVCDNW